MDCEVMCVLMQYVWKLIELMSSMKLMDRQWKLYNDDQCWWVVKLLSYLNNWRCNEYCCCNLVQVCIVSFMGKG